MSEVPHKSATAVLLIDDNNDFLSPKGALYEGVSEFLDTQNTVQNIHRLLGAARAKAIPIVRMPMAFSPGYDEMGPAPYGIFEIIKQERAFIAGSWGARSADAIPLAGNDTVLKGKCAASAFEQTGLDEWLTENGITTLVLAGLLSNICVEATMRAAYDRGYSVIIAEDCVAALTLSEHEAARDYNWAYFSYVMNSTGLFQPSPSP